MSNVMLRAFTSESQAKDYFNNKVVEATGVDGVMIKSASEIVFRKDGGGYSDLTENSRCFLVISFPHGTSIQIDSGSNSNGGNEGADVAEDDEGDTSGNS